MKRFSRADFLRAGAAGAAVAGAAYALPAGAAPGRLNDIDHFIILMQENRSFDHYFGTLRGVRGFDDAKALQLSTGRSVFYQPDPQNPDGYALPFHLDTKTTSAQRIHDLSHAWLAQHHSWNDGKMDNWLPTHRGVDKDGAGPLTMGYYTRDDLPFHYALADAFTICDSYHCSILGPTYPNRLVHMTGTIDQDGKYGGPATDNSAYGYKHVYTWETYPERLEQARVSWQIAYDDDDYALNVLEYFANYHNAPPGSPLRERALTARPMQQILSDISTGNLPSVTWLLPRKENCEHPSFLPAAGANYMHTILKALWANPKVWAKTALIVNYDENDGQFDHVAPPVPDPGTPGEFINGLPSGLGFRVPCFVISPFSRGGYVCSDMFDHTSVLRLLEARFGVEVPNVSKWRRETTGDLTSAFGFGEVPQLDVPELPETERYLADVEAALPKLPRPEPPLHQTMPQQEPGTRPRRGTV